jgi:hypothetical protein
MMTSMARLHTYIGSGVLASERPVRALKLPLGYYWGEGLLVTLNGRWATPVTEKFIEVRKKIWLFHPELGEDCNYEDFFDIDCVIRLWVRQSTKGADTRRK